MWLLSTRNRPAHCIEAVRTFKNKGSDGLQLVIWVDGDFKGYEPLYDIVKPGWVIRHTPECVGLAHQMNWLLEEYPAERAYGWLADDFRAETKDWDKQLVDEAEPCFIAYGNDGWSSPSVKQRHITSAFAIGGKIVRQVGWFAPPNLVQAGIDSAWNDLGRKFRLMKKVETVTVNHLHWKNGKRPVDATDNVGEQRDLGVTTYKKYITSPQHKEAIRLVREWLNGGPNLYRRYASQWIVDDGGPIRNPRRMDRKLPHRKRAKS